MNGTSTAVRKRTITRLFTTEEHPYYITLYFLGNFVGNYDNWNEIREAKKEILGY